MRTVTAISAYHGRHVWRVTCEATLVATLSTLQQARFPVPEAPALAAEPTALPSKPAEVVTPPSSFTEDREAMHSDAATGSSSSGEGRSGVSEGTIRVDVGLLDKLMNRVGELVLARNQILQFTSTLNDAAFLSTSQRLNLITTELQEGVMKTRMQPIGNLWSKFPRVVRDLALQCGKSVRIELQGKETELDKTIVEAIKDPLTHLVRNAVDHGIGSPEARLAAGLRTCPRQYASRSPLCRFAIAQPSPYGKASVRTLAGKDQRRTLRTFNYPQVSVLLLREERLLFRQVRPLLAFDTTNGGHWHGSLGRTRGGTQSISR